MEQRLYSLLPVRTLAELKLPVICREVVDKKEQLVLDEIENAILQVACTILQGHGFSYAIPNRSKGNQLFVPELDRIVLKSSSSQREFASTSTCRKAVITTRILQLVHELCTKRIHVTKRDLFYTDVKLFEVGGLAVLRTVEERKVPRMMMQEDCLFLSAGLYSMAWLILGACIHAFDLVGTRELRCCAG